MIILDHDVYNYINENGNIFNLFFKKWFSVSIKPFSKAEIGNEKNYYNYGLIE